jgi:hypothetical protein
VPSQKATLAIHVCFCAFLPQVQVYIRIFDLEIASYVLSQIIKGGFERYQDFKAMAALFSFDQNNRISRPCPLSLPLILNAQHLRISLLRPTLLKNFRSIRMCGNIVSLTRGRKDLALSYTSSKHTKYYCMSFLCFSASGLQMHVKKTWSISCHSSLSQ